MTAARSAPPWLLAVGLLAALPLTVVAPAVDPATGTWWPAGGLLAAGLLLAPGRARWWCVAGTVVVMGPLIAAAYDVAIPFGLVATSAFVLPALVVERGLRLTVRQARRDGPVRGFAGARYHAVVTCSAVLCGGLALVLSVSTEGWVTALQWGTSTLLGALTSVLLVLPLVAGSGGAPATGSRGELVAQRLLVGLVVASLFVGGTASAALATAAFPLLGWAALRATRRETHLQVCGLGIAAYVATTFAPGGGTQVVPMGLPDALANVPLFLFLASLSLFIVPLALAAERLSKARSDAVRNEATVQRMLDGASSTLLIASDRDGRVLHVNEGALQLLGHRREDVVGRWPTMFHSEAEIERQAADLGVDASLGACVARQVELGERRDWEFLRADGTTRIISLSINTVEDDDEVSLVVASGEDVTDRLRAQHALETALDREHRSVLRLQEVDHVKQELVSNVSHELRTPITSIAGYAELLSDSSLGELTRPQRDALERIERNAQRLQTLVDDLLTMSRAEAGRLQLSRATVDLGEVARSAWDLFGEQLRQRQLETALVLPPDPVPVIGDAGALERIVVNLVSNAIKFTADGGSVVLALSRRPDGTARLVVRDTGIGIAHEDQAELFTRFFRSQDVTDRAIQGTGLGLSIVQTLVAQHGGHVSVRSRPGEGTRVTVELPPT